MSPFSVVGEFWRSARENVIKWRKTRRSAGVCRDKANASFHKQEFLVI